MLCGALWELLEDRESFLQEMNALDMPGVKVYALPSVKQGVNGTHMQVTVHGQEEKTETLAKGSAEPAMELSFDEHHHHEHHHHHAHRSLEDVLQIILNLQLPDPVKQDAIAVYKLIAEAEATVHGTTPSEVHFHEVGSMDAVADIVSVCLLIHKISPELILASPVQTGTGKIRCAHGVLPVPAPATSLLLHGIPVYSGEINGELCTPTGAALLKHFVSSFGPLPVMNISAIGYGMGTKDYESANYLRAFLGETDGAPELSQGEMPKGAHAVHPVAEEEAQKKAILNRISRSIGHLQSVKRMVEENRSASDVLTQLSAVNSSIVSTSRAIMKNHFKQSLEAASKEEDPEALNRLYGIIDKFIK